MSLRRSKWRIHPTSWWPQQRSGCGFGCFVLVFNRIKWIVFKCPWYIYNYIFFSINIYKPPMVFPTINEDAPTAGWFIMENSMKISWCGGTPILGIPYNSTYAWTSNFTSQKCGFIWVKHRKLGYTHQRQWFDKPKIASSMAMWWTNGFKRGMHEYLILDKHLNKDGGACPPTPIFKQCHLFKYNI